MVALNDSVKTDSRLAAWNCRWRHLSNKVLGWPAPSGSDLPWFRTEVERAYYGRATRYINQLIDGSARPGGVNEIPIIDMMPSYSAIPGLIDHVVWAYDSHTDHRLRTREKTARGEAGPVVGVVRLGRTCASGGITWRFMRFDHRTGQTCTLL